MAAETTVGVSHETRAALYDVVGQMRAETGEWSITWDQVVRQLLADRAELRRLAGQDTP